MIYNRNVRATTAGSADYLGNVGYGQVWDDSEAGGKKLIEENSELITLSDDEYKAFTDKMQPVVDKWIAEANGNGMDGAAMVESARAAVMDVKD